jgi:hypothetical protein
MFQFVVIVVYSYLQINFQMWKFMLTFSICGIAASVSTRLQRKYNRWIRIENAYRIVYKYLKKEQKLKDLLRAQQF